MVAWGRQGRGWCGTHRESVCLCARAQLRTNLGGTVGVGGQPERPHTSATDAGAKPPVARVRPFEGKVCQDPSSSQELACGFGRT